MAKNYYSIHSNKSKRKNIDLGKFLSPERKRNIALNMFNQMPDELKKNISEMIIISKGFRRDKFKQVLGPIVKKPNGDITITGEIIKIN